MSLRLRALGGLSLEYSEGSPPGRSTQRKRLALLALLAATRNGGVSRDKIIAYLWPEAEAEQGRHALSQVLYALRRELGDQTIIAGIDELRLNDQVVPSDVAELNAAMAARDLETIVSVYGGPFLDGFFLGGAPGFEDWSAQRRAEYERAYSAALDELAARALAAGDAQRAVALLQSRAALDPLNSEVALRLMRALARAGDRAGALRHFRIHSALLQEEMQLASPAELAEFAAECLRSDERTLAAPTSSVMPQPPALAAPSTPPPIRRGAQQRRWYISAGVFAAAAALVLILTRSSGRAHDSHVLLAAVSGPDSSLSLAVREALRAELEQSKGVRVLSDMVAARTLELMRLPPSTTLDEPRALEVAHRRGIPFVVTASVQPVGTGVQIVARMVDVVSDRVVATETERPNREEDVLNAVASIADRMRERVTRTRPAPPSPLPAVTTSSLPALRNYALARRALAGWDRVRALELLEAALVHDSTFALAHYLAGDLLWYIDKQRHSDEHMQRALELVDRLPPREQLIVKARYQQLVRDEPDSALVYWKLLVDSYPDEPLAYEGMRWVYRALGRTREMAQASERGFRFEATQERNYYYDRMTDRLENGDSAGALEAATRLDKLAPARVLFLWQTRGAKLPAPSLGPTLPASDRQLFELLYHRFDNAAVFMDSLRHASLQFYPRALLAQGLMESEFGRPQSAQARLTEVVAWIEGADLSPPAYARLAERAAALAAQLGDRETLHRLRAIIDRHDRGRGLRSYRFARNTIAAADAFARRDYRRAALAGERGQSEMFYARSLATVLLLRADALRSAGQPNEARRIYQRLVQQRDFTDGDPETRLVIAHIAANRLTQSP
ncbi:MAG TPA: BTAD domain-containing putative transcriptional regulator [Longimicrobiales bacterium]